MSKIEGQRYVDILSDSGFKAVFGDQQNKPVLIDFLNAVLPEGRKVKDLTYSTTEIEGITPSNKSVRLDLRCEDEDGTSFIIEMQKYDQTNFFKRCVSYGSKVYDMKIKKGDYSYDVAPVYIIGILSIDYFDRSNPLWKDVFISDYAFREKRTGELVCETISLIFVELNRFGKPLEECQGIVDKWCYALKYMSRLDRLPRELQMTVFKKLFRAAEIAQFSPEKRKQYDQDMITERDEKNIRHTLEQKAAEKGRAEGRIEGHAEGLAEGLAEGRIEGIVEGLTKVAKTMKSSGVSVSDIMKFTGLSEEEIVKL